MDKLTAAVAAELSGYLSANGMTQKQLGEATGMHEKTIGRYLRCERDIDIRVIGLFAQALDFEPTELFERAQRRLERSAD